MEDVRIKEEQKEDVLKMFNRHFNDYNIEGIVMSCLFLKELIKQKIEDDERLYLTEINKNKELIILL